MSSRVGVNLVTPQGRPHGGQGPSTTSSHQQMNPPNQQHQMTQQNQKKQLLKSYQVMMSTKNGAKSAHHPPGQAPASANTSLLLASQQQQPRPIATGSTNLLQQKRISGSQQQIQAAIASKLQSQKMRKQAATSAAQQNQTSQQASGQISQHHSTTNTASTTSQHHQAVKNLKVKEQQRSGGVGNNQAVQQPSARASRSKDNAAIHSQHMIKAQQQHQAQKKQSLNNELAALCAKPNDTNLSNVLQAASGTKAKSGGVRNNVNIVQGASGGGLVGTPSATQRVTTAASALSNKKPQYVGKYQLQEIVGRGAFGRVYKGLNTATNEVVAIKMIPLIRLKTDFKKSIIDEIDLMKKLDHKNIVKYIETVQSGHQLCIVLEFIEGGSLEYLYKKFGCFSETLVAIYIKQVLKGLEYLHRQTVIHRDIKGGNILTTKDGVVKLADFGVATKLTDAEKNNSFAGTPHWMAPEVIEMSGNLTSASDIWSVGCTVYELLKGSPPNYDLNKFCAMIRNVREPMPIPDVVSPELRDFLQKCFTKDPTKRPSAAELIEHSWFKQLEKNKLARLLQKQSLPQEVTNTIKVHLDSQDESSENIAVASKSVTAAATAAEETQQKVKSVAKMLTRQNVSMQPQSQPILQIKGQVPATERQLKLQQSAQDQPNCNATSSSQPYKHPIIYSQAKNGVQTTVNLKKAIQDKLSAQAFKMTKVQDQKAKSSLATKNHLSQMAIMNQSANCTQQQQTASAATAGTANPQQLQPQQPIKEPVLMAQTNRANSATQRKGVLNSTMTAMGSGSGADVVAAQPHTQSGPTAQQHKQFNPSSTATNANLMTAVAAAMASDIGGGGSHPPKSSSNDTGASRPQTSLGLSTNQGRSDMLTNFQPVSATGNSFVAMENSTAAMATNMLTTGVQSSSNMAGSQTTTAAQQRTGGALFDLRGNKRLFHLSKKMIGNAASIPINNGSGGHQMMEGAGAVAVGGSLTPSAKMIMSSKNSKNNGAEMDKKGSDLNTGHNSNMMVKQQRGPAGGAQQIMNNLASNIIPASQLITEYDSPDQDTRLQAPHTSAAQEHRGDNQAAHRQNNNHTAEKHSKQQQQLFMMAAAGNGGPQVIQLKAAATTSGGVGINLMQNQQPQVPTALAMDHSVVQQRAVLKHSHTEDINLVSHPNFFKQWTEQTELTQNVVHGGGRASGQRQHLEQHSPPKGDNNYDNFVDQDLHNLAHNEERCESETEDSPAHKFSNQPDMLRKPNWPIKIYQQPQQQQQQQQLEPQTVAGKSLILAAPSINKSAEMMPKAGSPQYQTSIGEQFQPGGKAAADGGPQSLTAGVGYEDEQQMEASEMESGHRQQPQHQHQLTTQQQQRSMYSEEKHRIMVDATRRNAMSSLSQNYPSANAHGHAKQPVSNIITATSSHGNVVHSLTATGHYQYPQSTMNNAHAQHKSLGAPGGVMHTAKASQKQARLRSPLAGQLPFGSNEYQHTTVDAIGGMVIGADRDESDLGDLDEEDDTSKTLFQQFVTRTNLGLNRKPSNTTSLSGTTTLAPQKKGIGATLAAATASSGHYNVVSSTTRGDRKGQQSRDGGYNLPGQQSSSMMTGGTSKYQLQQQPQEVKQQLKRAADSGIKQAALIKRKIFLLETVVSGDTHLMQVIVANSTHSCCSSSGGEEEEDGDALVDSDNEAKFRHEQCERNQFTKTPGQLSNELCLLIKAVINGETWPLQHFNNSNLGGVNAGVGVGAGEFSGMDDLILTQFTPLINDAFKEAFLSQLSFSDIIEMLDMDGGDESGEASPTTETIAYTTLQLINQLAEGNVGIQRQFFAAGLIQKLQEFTGPSVRREVKVEVAYFIGRVFQHSKELIGIYMGCQGYKIQLDFIQLSGQDQFSDNLYLIMIAIDSILVMFEECPSQTRSGNQFGMSHSQNSQSAANNPSSKRHQMHSPGGAAVSMSDRDLAKILTKAGLMEPLSRQIPNFLQLAELSFYSNSSAVESKEGQNALMYLERIFDIFINLAICGQHTVRQQLCSEKVMGANLTQVVHSLAISSPQSPKNPQAESQPIRYQISKWYVKLVIALTSQQQAPQSSSAIQMPFSASALQEAHVNYSGSGQIVIFEKLGQCEVVAVLACLVPLYVQHHQNNSSTDAVNYLASLYETLKLLNLLAKMSPARCEQACHAGQIVPAVHQLISYLEGIGQFMNQGGAVISRSKKCRLINASLQLLHELVVACLSTRTALLEHEIPNLLLQLFHLKASSCYNSSTHSQNKSHGTHSLSLQSANNNLRMINVAATLSGNTNQITNPQATAQDQEIVSRILDIFVLWVQQDDQTGQIMQEIVANQQSLEVIFSLISLPRRQKSGALFAFFNALTRILLASDRVIEALLQHVHLIVHLSAILVFLSEHLARSSSGNSNGGNYSQHQHHSLHTQQIIDTSAPGTAMHQQQQQHPPSSQSQQMMMHQGGQTGATPLSRRADVASATTPGNVMSSNQPQQNHLVEHQGRLATQWRDCFNNESDVSAAGSNPHHFYHQQQLQQSHAHHHQHGGSHEHLGTTTQSRLRSQDRTRGTTAGLMMAAVAMEGQAAAVVLSTQQTTQILKELLEIFQLLVQYQHQVSLTGNPTCNFIVQLDLRRTIEQVLKIATDASLVILQSMSSQLLQQINEHLSVTGGIQQQHAMTTPQSSMQQQLQQLQFYPQQQLQQQILQQNSNEDVMVEDSVTEQEQFSGGGGSSGPAPGFQRLERSMTPNSSSAMMFQHHQQHKYSNNFHQKSANVITKQSQLVQQPPQQMLLESNKMNNTSRGSHNNNNMMMFGVAQKNHQQQQQQFYYQQQQ